MNDLGDFFMRVKVLENGNLLNNCFLNILKQQNVIEYYFICNILETLKEQKSNVEIEIRKTNNCYYVDGFIIE